MPGRGSRLTASSNKERKRFTDATGEQMRPDQEELMLRMLQQQQINQRAPGVSRIGAATAAQDFLSRLVGTVAPAPEGIPSGGVTPTRESLSQVNARDAFGFGIDFAGLHLPSGPLGSSDILKMKESGMSNRQIMEELASRNQRLRSASRGTTASDPDFNRLYRDPETGHIFSIEEGAPQGFKPIAGGAPDSPPRGFDFLRNRPTNPQQASRFAEMEAAREKARPIRDFVERDAERAQYSPENIARELEGNVQASLDEITRGTADQWQVQAFDEHLRKLINFKREAGLPLTAAERREVSRFEQSGSMQSRLQNDNQINQMIDRLQEMKVTGVHNGNVEDTYMAELQRLGLSRREIDDMINGPLGGNVQEGLRLEQVRADNFDVEERLYGIQVNGFQDLNYTTANALEDLERAADGYPKGVLPPSYEEVGNAILDEIFRMGGDATLAQQLAGPTLERTLKWKAREIQDAYQEFLKDGRVFRNDNVWKDQIEQRTVDNIKKSNDLVSSYSDLKDLYNRGASPDILVEGGSAILDKIIQKGLDEYGTMARAVGDVMGWSRDDLHNYFEARRR